MKPITIALPGEKQNEKRVKEFLLSEGLMNQSDINLDTFLLKGTNTQLITLRVGDALKYLDIGSIDGVINGEDAITDLFIEKKRRRSREGNDVVVFDQYISGYCGVLMPDMNKRISKVFTLDDDSPTKLCTLTRTEDPEKTLEAISRRGDILTSYPYLVRMLLARKFGGGQVGRIQKSEGRIEAQLALSMGMSAVDIVDTGRSAAKNNLRIGNSLFESYPIGIFPDRALREDLALSRVVKTLTDASNNAYYKSSRYGQRFSRG